MHADGIISIGGIITRGESLHDHMREMVEKFASENTINDFESLRMYYSPTIRQEKLIKNKVRSKGNFAKGWADAFVSDKFGEATTHWRKLEDRVKRGVGNPCPLLLIGIPKEVVAF